MKKDNSTIDPASLLNPEITTQVRAKRLKTLADRINAGDVKGTEDCLSLLASTATFPPDPILFLTFCASLNNIPSILTPLVSKLLPYCDELLLLLSLASVCPSISLGLVHISMIAYLTKGNTLLSENTDRILLALSSLLDRVEKKDLPILVTSLHSLVKVSGDGHWLAYMFTLSLISKLAFAVLFDTLVLSPLSLDSCVFTNRSGHVQPVKLFISNWQSYLLNESRLIDVILNVDSSEALAEAALGNVQSLLLLDSIVPHISHLCDRSNEGNKACLYLLQLAGEYLGPETCCRIIAGGSGGSLVDARKGMDLYVKECVEGFVEMSDVDKRKAVKNLYGMREEFVELYIPLALILVEYFVSSGDKNVLILFDSIAGSNSLSRSPANVFGMGSRLLSIYLDPASKSDIVAICKRIIGKLARLGDACIPLLARALDIAERGYTVVAPVLNVDSEADIPKIRSDITEKMLKISINTKRTDALDTRLSRLVSSLLLDEQKAMFAAYVGSRVNPPFALIPFEQYDLPRSGVFPRDAAVCSIVRERMYLWRVFEVLSRGIPSVLIVIDANAFAEIRGIIVALLANLVVFWNQKRWSISKAQSEMYEFKAAERVMRILGDAGVIDARVAGLVQVVLDGGKQRGRVLLMAWDCLVGRISREVFEEGVHRMVTEGVEGVKVDEDVFGLWS